MALEQKFNEAAENVKGLTKRPTDDELLQLYGLYKQAKIGNNDTTKPGFLDLKAKYKWESWDKRRNMSKESAMEEYVKLAEQLISVYS